MNDHQELVEKFVASFPFVELDPVAAQHAADSEGRHGLSEWRPASVKTAPAELDSVYARLPARFPPLYEQLLPSYRWADVDLQDFTLLANPPGEGLKNLLRFINGDGHMTPELLKNGYIQFGRATGGHYDPVCFDIRSRKNRDYRIVKIDHEEILCNDRIKV